MILNKKQFSRKILEYAKKFPQKWNNFDSTPLSNTNDGKLYSNYSFMEYDCQMTSDEFKEIWNKVWKKYPIYSEIIKYHHGHDNGIGFDLNDKGIFKHEKIMWFENDKAHYGIIEKIWSSSEIKKCWFLIKEIDTNRLITKDSTNVIKI